MAISDYFIDFQTGNIATTIGIGVLIIIILLFLGVLSYFVVLKYLFNKTLIIFEKVGGQIQVVRRDKAREIRLGDAGDTAFVARKSKKNLPRAEIQTGKNTYWYYIRSDGEWINFGIEDIDLVMKTLKAHFVDKDMRYARLGLQKNFEKRLQKITFWDKYGAWIMWSTYLLLTGIMTWLLFDKWLELSSDVGSMIDAAAKIVESAEQLLVAMDNINSGGSGIVPAT